MEPWISVSTTRDAARVDGRDGPARFEPARLDGFEDGARFGVWWTPAEREPRGTILCVQPLGDERSCARRVIAAQAWRLAARGWVVLVPDLFGCGDSAGEPSEVTLGAWRNDLLRCAMLVRRRAQGPSVLWGVRAGALLVVDIAVALDQLLDAHLFWQAPENGRSAADALAASSGLPARLLESLGELRMHAPPTAERGSLPAVTFVEANEASSTTGDVSLATRSLTESWLDAGYLAGARAARVPAFWDTTQFTRPLPDALFDATEDFLASVH
ncbi:MAG TPA: hypothetical protein VGE10_02505 [Zeimonas sp.]